MRHGSRHRQPDWRPTAGGRGARGFTHIEVLIAILIIGMATPIFVGGLVGSLSGARRSQERAVAVAWLQGEVDVLRAQCFSTLGPSARKITPSTLRVGEPPLPAGFAVALVRITPAGGSGDAPLLRAAIGLYRRDWEAAEPAESPVASVVTYLSDLRVAGACP
jgi:prepilin-type N-terminal cleavage/methylation domain-containing protein